MEDSGFFLGNIEEAPELLRASVGSLVPVADGARVIALHAPAGTRVTEVDMLRMTDASSHIVVVVERGAEVTLPLWLEGAQAHHAAEVILAEEAHCTVLTVNAADPTASVRIKQRSQVGSGSSVKWQNVTVGGADVEHDLVSRITGDNAESAIEWMCYAKGTERQALTVRNVFDGRDGGGEILMRGIAEDRGHIVCKGLIDIGLQGGGTNTYLTQEVLMLDVTSKVDAIPGLEIKTNDVKASHSATVARVTEEDLFYFGARGINPHEARRMFVLGFLGDIAGRITSATAREAVIAAIEEKYAR